MFVLVEIKSRATFQQVGKQGLSSNTIVMCDEKWGKFPAFQFTFGSVETLPGKSVSFLIFMTFIIIFLIFKKFGN